MTAGQLSEPSLSDYLEASNGSHPAIEAPSSGTDDWAELPESFGQAEEPGVPDEPSEDVTGDEAPTCPVCDKPIFRDPSWKRMHKYHDECRPSAGKTNTTTRPSGSSKAEKEADAIVSTVRSGLVKAALFVGMVDKYDGLVILVNLDSVCANFRGILIQYPKFRAECQKTEGGGSIFGLVTTGLFMLLPIMAHHGMLPGRIGQMVIDLPFLMFKLSQKMKESEENLKGYMDEQFSTYYKTHPSGGGQTVQGETVKPQEEATVGASQSR